MNPPPSNVPFMCGAKISKKELPHSSWKNAVSL